MPLMNSGAFLQINHISMEERNYGFSYQVYTSHLELNASDAALLEKARAVTAEAYAPYSHFHVSAVALMENGAIVTGTNQENASYPVGICAERSLLASVAALHPGVRISSIAISYNSKEVVSDHPVSPCGMCRQALLEYENRLEHPIRLILAGMTGEVFIIPKADQLLPFAFTKEELKK